MGVISSKLAEVNQTINQNAAANPGDNPRDGAVESAVSGKARKLATALFCAVGSGAVLGVVSSNPVIATAIKGAFAKAGGFISSNLAAFSSGTMGAGVLNVLDGVRSIYRGGIQRSELTALNKTLSQTDRNSPEFSRLKKLYKTTQIRGTLQAAVGAAAIAVGALAFAGVVSNPIGLGAVLAVGAATLIGVQIHKFYQHRKIVQAEKQYDAAYDRMVGAKNQSAETQVMTAAPARAVSIEAEPKAESSNGDGFGSNVSLSSIGSVTEDRKKDKSDNIASSSSGPSHTAAYIVDEPDDDDGASVHSARL